MKPYFAKTDEKKCMKFLIKKYGKKKAISMFESGSGDEN